MEFADRIERLDKLSSRFKPSNAQLQIVKEFMIEVTSFLENLSGNEPIKPAVKPAIKPLPPEISTVNRPPAGNFSPPVGLKFIKPEGPDPRNRNARSDSGETLNDLINSVRRGE